MDTIKIKVVIHVRETSSQKDITICAGSDIHHRNMTVMALRILSKVDNS